MSNYNDMLNADIMKVSDEELYGILNQYKTDGLSDDQLFRDRAILSNDFYSGYQWDNASLEELRKKHLPALTFNIIKKTVEFVVGTQEQNRKDITCKPVKNATNSIASILTKLIKDIITKNNGEHLLSEWFRGGCIKGREFIHAFRDYQLDPWTGDIKLEVVNALDVVIDPNSKMYDLSDSKYFILFKYVNRDAIIAKYPKHRTALINLKTDEDEAIRQQDELTLYGGSDLGNNNMSVDESRYNNRSNYRFRIQWSYVMQSERRWHAIDKQDMIDYILPTQESVEVWKAYAEQDPERYEVIERADNVLYLIKSIEDIILEKVKEPFRGEVQEEFYRNPPDQFPIVPFGAYHNGGRWQGIIDDLIDPQMEKNKLRSSVLHIISTTANSGWAYEENSVDAETEHNLHTTGASTGFNIKYKKGSQPPTKIPPNQLPQGAYVLAEQSNQDINDISGVNAANLGATTSQESGKLNELRQIQGITTNTGVYDHFDHSMKILGELLVGIIRSTDIYTMQEIETIVEDFDIFDDKVMQEASQILQQQSPIPTLEELLREADAQDQESQQKIIQAYQQMMEIRQKHTMEIAKMLVLEEMHNLYKGRYGIAIAASNFSPTVKNANMQLLFEISRIMPGIIPPDYLISQSDLPDKNIILKSIQQRQQAAQQAAMEQERMKINGQIALAKVKNEGKINEENTKAKNDVVTNNLQQ